MLIQNLYYTLKPYLPRWLQIALRRKYVQAKQLSCGDKWPIDKEIGARPAWFSGWPGQKRFALVLTHDVETARGQDKCHKLINLEMEHGFRSSFSFVPRRYNVSPELRDYLIKNGFEVAVHGLYHDGSLFRNRRTFEVQAAQINGYLKEWNAIGFRSPSMQTNLDWIHDLDIEYDSSTFDTDPFEPSCTRIRDIFPFWVLNNSQTGGYVEIPYTLPQDFTLFILMQENNINTWKRKLDWVVEKNGVALLITHPDYMNFGDTKPTIEEYPADFYAEFLDYVKERYKDQYWHALPRNVADFFKTAVPAPFTGRNMA